MQPLIRPMKSTLIKFLALGIVMLAGALPGKEPGPAELILACHTSSAQRQFAAGKLGEALGGKIDLIPLARATDTTNITVACGETEAASLGLRLDTAIQKEGFQIVRKQERIFILGKDETGTMYGLLDVAEQAQMHGGLGGVKEKIANPRFAFRAIKFNLP